MASQRPPVVLRTIGFDSHSAELVFELGMKKAKIGVTDDDVRQRGAECGTFSEEYWLSMTEAQQTALVDARKGVLVRAAQLVRTNETDAAIGDKMERLRRSKNEDDELVRDIYFSIADESVRIKAINDLFDFESARKSHDSAMVREAHYRLIGVRKMLNRGWPFWPKLWRFALWIIALIAISSVVGSVDRFFWKAENTHGPSFESDWVFFTVLFTVAFFLQAIAFWADLKFLERHYLWNWEIEKLRRGVREELHLEVLVRRYALFGDMERRTGIRSLRREFN